MNRLVIFRGRVPDEKPGGEKNYDQYWYRSGSGDHRLTGMFPSCEMLIEKLVERTEYLGANRQPWTIEFGPDRGFEFIPGVGLYHYLPFTSEQIWGLWEQLCK